MVDTPPGGDHDATIVHIVLSMRKFIDLVSYVGISGGISGPAKLGVQCPQALMVLTTYCCCYSRLLLMTMNESANVERSV